MNPDTRGLLLLIAIPLAIVAGIHWVLIRFTHWSFSLVLAVFISLAFAFVFVGYKNATPNGGNRKIPGMEYVLPAVVVFCIQLPIMWYWSISSVGEISKSSYWAVAGLLLTAVLVFTGYQIYTILKSKAFYAKSFSKCQLKVASFDPNIKIQELGFESWILNYIDLKRESGAVLFEGVYSMPRFAEKLRVRALQSKLGTIQHMSIPLDYKLFKETYAFPEIKYPETFFFRHWDVADVSVVFEKEGMLKFFVDNSLIKECKLVDHMIQ